MVNEYSEILEKGYLDVGQVKTEQRNGYIFSEISAFILFERQKQYITTSEFKAHAIYHGGISKYFNTNLSALSLTKLYNEFLLELTAIYGKPNLILFSSKHNEIQDEILLKSFEKILPDIVYYTPVHQFGYHQGCSTVFNFILAIMFFKYQRLPNTAKIKNHVINHIFVITISENTAIFADILSREIS